MNQPHTLTLDDVNQYLLDQIKAHVWGGFSSPNDIQEMISDLLEDGCDEKRLRKSVNIEFQKKLYAEESWPKITDIDRLNSVFKTLNENGILCSHNAGYTTSDGHEISHDLLRDHLDGDFFGYCFYHGQDLERAVLRGGLYLAYDHVNGDVPEKIKVALIIQKELEKGGFTLDWDGTTNTRLCIPNFDWKHRTSPQR